MGGIEHCHDGSRDPRIHFFGNGINNGRQYRSGNKIKYQSRTVLAFMNANNCEKL